jgi:hypothetical protein
MCWDQLFACHNHALDIPAEMVPMSELAIEEDCLALLIISSTSPLCRDALTLACMTSKRAMWTESSGITGHHLSEVESRSNQSLATWHWHPDSYTPIGKVEKHLEI